MFFHSKGAYYHSAIFNLMSFSTCTGLTILILMLPIFLEPEYSYLIQLTILFIIDKGNLSL